MQALGPDQVQLSGRDVQPLDVGEGRRTVRHREQDLVLDRALLGREAKAHQRPDRLPALADAIDLLDQLEPRQHGRLAEQVLQVAFARDDPRRQVGLPLSAPVAEHVTEQVLGRPGAVGVQLLDPGVELGKVVGRVQHGRSPRQVGPPLVQQPVADRMRRPDVVLVVGRDGVERVLRPVLHPALVLQHRAGTRVDVVAALVARQALDGFEPVGLGADLHGVAHGRQQVHEGAGLDEVRQHHLGDPVLFDQRFQRGPLGVVVVVDVHPRVLSAALGQVLDQLGRPVALLGLVVRPPAQVLPGPVLAALNEAEQEEQATGGAPEGVALEVEEHVAGVGCREQ